MSRTALGGKDGTDGEVRGQRSEVGITGTGGRVEGSGFREGI
jgi:hypothetical protein